LEWYLQNDYWTSQFSSAVFASEPAAHTQQRRGNIFQPASPTAEHSLLLKRQPEHSDTNRSAAILPPSASYPKRRGRQKKPIEEQICSEADLKEKRDRQI